MKQDPVIKSTKRFYKYYNLQTFWEILFFLFWPHNDLNKNDSTKSIDSMTNKLALLPGIINDHQKLCTGTQGKEKPRAEIAVCWPDAPFVSARPPSPSHTCCLGC